MSQMKLSEARARCYHLVASVFLFNKLHFNYSAIVLVFMYHIDDVMHADKYWMKFFSDT